MSKHEPPAEPKDRRLLGLLALAVLLVGVAAGVELYRRWFLRAGPEKLPGDFGFKLPPAAPTPEPGPERPPPSREVSAERFLTILARETPRPVARRFATAFTRNPRLKKAFAHSTRAGLAQTPARVLLKALLSEPDFRALVIESRSDPGFRSAFAQLARNPEVGGPLRAGTVGLVRPPPDVTALSPVDGPSGRPDPGAGFAGAPPPTRLPDTPPPADGERGDLRHEEARGPEAHDVSPTLAAIERPKGEQLASSYFSSMFKELRPEFRQYLEDRCDDFKNTELGCDVKTICRDSLELLQACKEACAKSPKCPQDSFQED
ncbi:MAG: hypothetical protein HY553_03565 [Elusimicrobia bacterium]|nr:hypothetical protein [Elusimicrobiota bacterium]